VKGDGLALIFGKGKPKSEMEESESEESEGGDELPPDFEDYALSAFPEFEGKPKRLKALYNMVRCCSEG
jgi:hypothetical protein